MVTHPGVLLPLPVATIQRPLVGTPDQPPEESPLPARAAALPARHSLAERLLRRFLLIDPISRLNYLVLGRLLARRAARPLLPYAQAVDQFLDALFRGRRLGYYCAEARQHLATLRDSDAPAARRAAIAAVFRLAADLALNAQLTQSHHLRRLIIHSLLGEALPRARRESEVGAIVGGLEHLALRRVTQNGRVGEPSPDVQVVLINGLRDALLEHDRAVRAWAGQRQWITETGGVYRSVFHISGRRCSLLYSMPDLATPPYQPFPLSPTLLARLAALLVHYRDRRPPMPDSQQAATHALAALAAASAPTGAG